MTKIGFLGLGVMGLHMALNVDRKMDLEVIGYDVGEQQMQLYRDAGGTLANNIEELYKTCDVILQMLPTHAIIQHSVEEAIRLGKPGRLIVDLSSASPDIILALSEKATAAGMFLLDSPVSGGNTMAKDGTLSIMVGGDRA
uniref:NAD(P)-dependent oxidoreductase n=1 Tax=Oscillibacter sp. TaxID=1945593 RepID=UPI00289E32B9